MEVFFYLIGLAVIAFVVPWMATYAGSIFSALGAALASVVAWFQKWIVPEANPDFRTDRSTLNVFEVFRYRPDPAAKHRRHQERKRNRHHRHETVAN